MKKVLSLLISIVVLLGCDYFCGYTLYEIAFIRNRTSNIVHLQYLPKRSEETESTDVDDDSYEKVSLQEGEIEFISIESEKFHSGDPCSSNTEVRTLIPVIFSEMTLQHYTICRVAKGQYEIFEPGEFCEQGDEVFEEDK